MRIDVTEEDLKDLKEGIRGGPSNCPVALAVNRATGKKSWVATYGVSLYDDIEHYYRKVHQLPPDVTRKIQLIDEGITVYPFSFDL